MLKGLKSATPVNCRMILATVLTSSTNAVGVDGHFLKIRIVSNVVSY
jgi:hypothetical protein